MLLISIEYDNMETHEVKPIKTIIFDWAGVFCTPGEPFTHEALTHQTGLNVDQLGAEASDLQKLYYRGKISTDIFWKGVIELFSLEKVTPEMLDKEYLASYLIYPGMLEFAGSLRKHYRIVLLSNLTESMMNEIMVRQNAKSYFDHLIFSNEIGHMKPEANSFLIALEVAGAEANETLFIDDSCVNVKAAIGLGMRGIQFEGGNIELLKEKLAENSISIV